MIEIGDSFGSYTVVQRLGKGGMGEVWLLEAASGAQVAAKILDPETAGDHEARKRFLREAQLALGVKHPNLVETYDVGEDPDTGLCYILMEYVPGGTLADYLKENGALPIEDAVAVVEAIAGVLELGRQKGIVHRDIKPANIMFAADGTPKLADLGIARGGSSGTETTTVTQTGMMIGTPAYMAPEQMLDAHNVDTRADIYSLGVVFFEMLTGERPNKDDTVVQLMAKAVKGEPLPDVRTLRPEVSASLAQLLGMMVAPDKEGRISTPGQITNALDIIERGGEFAADTERIRRQREAKREAIKRRRAKERKVLLITIVSTLTVAIASIATVAYFLFHKRAPLKSIDVASAAPQIVAATNIVQPDNAKLNDIDVVRTNVVQVTVVKTNAVTVGHENASAPGSGVPDGDKLQPAGNSAPRFQMACEHYASEWLEGGKDQSHAVRVCLDFSHGGFPSLSQAFYAKWLALDGSNQKACWYDLASEDLQSVNLLILPSSSTQQQYEPQECARIDEFLRNGGTVIVICDALENKIWPKERFLARHGIGVFVKSGCQLLSKKQQLETVEVALPCSALGDLKLKLPNTVHVEPVNDEGVKAWTPLAIDAEDNLVLMAMRSVGNGHLVLSTSCRYYGSDAGDIGEVWKRIFFAAAKSRQISADVPIGQRPITDAPVVKSVGPITLYSSLHWQSNCEELARIAAAGLPVLEKYCGKPLTPDKMSATRFVLADTCSWGMLALRHGDKTLVTSATYRGFPERKAKLAAFLFRSMISDSLGFLREIFMVKYIAMLAFCDIGYQNEMEMAIEEGRKMGDVDNSHYRWENGKIVDASTNMTVKDAGSTIAEAKFFAAYEEMRRIDPDFVVKLVTRLRSADSVSNSGCVNALSAILGVDSQKIFEKYAIVLPLRTARPKASTNPYANRPRDESVDNRIWMAKAGGRTWFYHLIGNDAALWRGNNGYNSSTRSCVEPEPTGRLDIPSVLDGHRVIRIESLAFFRCKELRSVKIPEGVKELRGWGCFYGCPNLKSIELPSSLERIDSRSAVFDRCSALASIDLKNCKFVEGTAFSGCKSLRSINVSQGNEFYCSRNGALYNKGMDRLVAYPKTQTSLMIPRSVREIGNAACVSCAFRGSVEVPAHVEEIGRRAFCFCEASSIVVSGARSVMDDAFSYCYSLAEVRFSDRLEAVGHSLFEADEKLKNVIFAGDAPKYVDDQRNSVFGGKCARFTIGVKKGSKGWKSPGSVDLPSVWPIEGLESSRPISFVSGRAATATSVATGSNSGFTPAQIRRMKDFDGWRAMCKATETMFRGWRVCSQQRAKFPKARKKNNVGDEALGYLSEYKGIKDVLRTCGDGYILERPTTTHIGAGQHLHFWACSAKGVVITVEAGGARMLCEGRALEGEDWEEFDIDLKKIGGTTMPLVINVTSNFGRYPIVQWHGIEVKCDY